MNRDSKRFLYMSIAVTVIFAGFIVVTILSATAPRAFAQETSSAAAGPTAAPHFPDEAYGLAFMSAAVVMGLACLAAGIAVGMTGSAAIGAVAERPELMGRTILIVGLAEGIAIYGLIIAIMILSRIPT